MTGGGRSRGRRHALELAREAVLAEVLPSACGTSGSRNAVTGGGSGVLADVERQRHRHTRSARWSLREGRRERRPRASRARPTTDPRRSSRPRPRTSGRSRGGRAGAEIRGEDDAEERDTTSATRRRRRRARARRRVPIQRPRAPASAGPSIPIRPSSATMATALPSAASVPARHSGVMQRRDAGER